MLLSNADTPVRSCGVWFFVELPQTRHRSQSPQFVKCSSENKLFFFSAVKKKKPSLLAPLLPLGFIMIYQVDAAYGTLAYRMRGKTARRRRKYLREIAKSATIQASKG